MALNPRFGCDNSRGPKDHLTHPPDSGQKACKHWIEREWITGKYQAVHSTCYIERRNDRLCQERRRTGGINR